jgi:hypothetical protein
MGLGENLEKGNDAFSRNFNAATVNDGCNF